MIHIFVILVFITFIVSCSNSVKFTREGRVLILVSVVGPPSFTNCEDMNSEQHHFHETPQQSIEYPTFPIPSMSSPVSEALHLNHPNGMREPLSSPISIGRLPFSEPSPPTLPRAEIGFFPTDSKEWYGCDYQNSCAAQTLNNHKSDDMTGDVNSLETHQTGEQNAALSLSRINAGDSESLANTEKVVEDVVWLEFHIIDTGIGISGISSINI